MDILTDILNDVTFVFPVRVDCMERQANLQTVLHFLIKETDSWFIILEADKEPKLNLPFKTKRIRYIFVEDKDPIFHRTKYLNQLLLHAQTSITGLWDTDVILQISQISEACSYIQNNQAVMSFPYNGRFLTTNSSMADEFRKSLNYTILRNAYPLYGKYATGGAFLVDRNRYLEAGGENENFYGWGPEDAERVKRMEILEFPIFRAKGNLYHLYHPRGKNSYFYDEKRRIQNLKELLKICAMNKQELLDYIATWGKL
jgi:predicted glycosyltransferase involved in capsule biosynthesis